MEISQGGFVSALLGAFGGGAVIVLALSAWLGKLWADRLMASEQAAHAERLKGLEANLRHQVDASLALVKTQLDLQRGKHEKAHADKLACYDAAVHRMAKLFEAMNGIAANPTAGQIFAEAFAEFEAFRFEIYGRMALVAPQPVLDAYDALVNHLLDGLETRGVPDVFKTRQLSLNWINAARLDLGVDPAPIEFRGPR
ncbi:hypothetical protein [Acidovorax sp. A1169]|uniref:hypothetical protein n=1 Tax=Acidovorax sp. A1169 TaxID=3059524 RepID=UPI002737D852|nr:hypothetical protein [Acidovorax sp. A1169]MDP4076269.1 hypothetical protein [Acidovorax sp. A1169]